MTFNDSFKLILNCKSYLIYCTVKPSTSVGSVSANSTNCGLCTMFKIGSWLNPSMQNPQIRRANCGTRAAWNLVSRVWIQSPLSSGYQRMSVFINFKLELYVNMTY